MILSVLCVTFFFLRVGATSWRQSHSIHQRIIRGPLQTLQQSETFILGSISEANPYWLEGPNILRIPTNGNPLTLLSSVQQEDLIQRVLCVVDGRAVFDALKINATLWECELSFSSFGGLHSVASYGIVRSVDGLHRPELLGDPLLFTRDSFYNEETNVKQLLQSENMIRLATPPTTGTLGVYYTTYLSPLAQLYQNITRQFGWTYTMESVLQNESLMFADSVWKYGKYAASIEWQNYSQTCDPMHQEPALGMYCLYRKRGNETYGPIPDCPESSFVIKTHSSQLSSAGFDFLATDFTNWDSDPRNETIPGSDFYQLRHLEIIAEEFADARMKGQATPQLSVFAQVNIGGVLWRWYLDELFNNKTLLDLDLVFRNRNTSRVPGFNKVFIAADFSNLTDYDVISQIASNDGLNDVTVPLMWFAPNASGTWEESGRLSYFSRCISVHEESGEIDFSSDAWLDLDTPCNHKKTNHSSVGSSWTVSTGLSINSVPFGGIRFNGLLLKKQWWDVLADPEPTDFLFAPSWNEFGAKAYNLSSRVGTNNPAFFASGANSNDPDRFVLFEDGYGAQRSRSIEPSKEDGGYYYETFASCVRVYRLQAALGIISNGTGCDVAGEDCCTVHENESFVHSWSLDFLAGDGTNNHTIDSILTSSSEEFTALKDTGWVEICVPTIFGRGPTSTCVDPTLPFQGVAGIDKASRGPFVLYSNVSTPSEILLPLVRCKDSTTGKHSVTNSTNGCSLLDMEHDGVLGYGQVRRDSLFARSLHRCQSTINGTGLKRWYTTINIPCLGGDEDDGVLLYAI